MMPPIGKDSGSAVSMLTPAGSGWINQRVLSLIKIKASQMIMKMKTKTVMKLVLIPRGNKVAKVYNSFIFSHGSGFI